MLVCAYRLVATSSKWPGVNEAFLFSFFLSTVLALAVIPYAKRRPKGKPVSWGEAMLAAVYAFGVMFLAFGIVPHHWIAHSDADLGVARRQHHLRPVRHPQAARRSAARFPITLPYEAIRDIVVVLHPRLVLRAAHLHLGLVAEAWRRQAGTEVATSTYGRPLVKKG